MNIGPIPEVDTAPRRITLFRSKGWRMPPNTVKVSRPTRWGNPFEVEDILHVYDGDREAAQADCVRSYRRWIEEDEPGSPPLSQIQSHLRGKNLACWCKPGTPCHADVLLELANK